MIRSRWARRTTEYVLLVALVALVLPLSSSAERGGSWHQTGGPLGAQVHVLQVDPARPHILYAGTNAGLLRSQDGADHWQKVLHEQVRALAIDPANTDRVLAGTAKGQVLQSSDGGTTWNVWGGGLARRIIWSILLHPSGAYVGSDRLYRMRDGKTWSALSIPNDVGRVSAIAALADAPDQLFAGTDAGVLISDDAGETWRLSSRGMPDSGGVEALVTAPCETCSEGFLLLAGTGKGLYRSEDSAASWQPVTQGIGLDLVGCLAYTSIPEPLFLAGVRDKGLLRSLDGGVTWDVIAQDLRGGMVTALAMDTVKPDQIYAGTSEGLYQSRVAGMTWQAAHESIVGTNVQALSFAGRDDRSVVASTRWGVFRTEDSGETWRESDDARDLNVISLLDMGSGSLYAGTWSGQLQHSADGGESWQLVHGDVSSGRPITGLAARPDAGDADGQGRHDLFAGTSGKGVLQSQDGGRTWAPVGQLLSNAHVRALILDVERDALFAGTDSGLFAMDLTAPPGADWQAETGLPREEVRAIAIAPGAMVLAATTDALYRSEAGQSWASVGGDSLRRLDVAIQALAVPVGRRRADALYMGADRGILVSRDAGDSWAFEQEGLDCQALIALSGSPDTLYAAVRDQGIWAGSDGAGRFPFWIIGLGAGLLAVGGTGLAIRRRRPAAVESSPVRFLEENWPEWDKLIQDELRVSGEVTPDGLPTIPRELGVAALQCYLEVHPERELIWHPDASTLQFSEPWRIRAFVQNWEAAQNNLDNPAEFRAATSRLTNQMCNYLGFTRIASRTYKNLNGYVIEGLTLRLRIPARFPLIFLRSAELGPEDVLDLRNLMDILHMTSYFGLVFVFGPGTNVAQLRELAGDSAHDFVVLGFRDIFETIIARQRERHLTQLVLKQMDLTVISPYVSYGPVPDTMFFGREAEIKSIMRTIEEKSFALVGGRKIGKTSILIKLGRMLGEMPGYLPFHLDCQAVRDQGAFYEAIASRWGVQLPEAVGSTSFDRVLAAIQDRAGPGQIVFLLDEVDGLLAQDAGRNEPLFRAFRALSQENRCRFVFCGERVLSDQLQDGSSPLFNFCEVLRLGFLASREARQVILGPLAEMGIPVIDPDVVVDTILDISSCHPNIVQYICQQLMVEINDKTPREVTLASVERVVASRFFADYYLSVTWGSATALEKLTTLLMIDAPLMTAAELVALLSQDHGIRISQRDAEEALGHLVLCSVLDRQMQYHAFAAQAFPDIVESTQDVPDLVETLKYEIASVQGRQARGEANAATDI